MTNSLHPITRGVSLEGAIWAGDTQFKSQGGEVLIAAGKVPLVVMKGNELVLNLDPGRSTIFTLPAWPVLVANTVEHLFRNSPGLKRFSYRLGERLSFTRPPSWKGEIQVERPDGSRIGFHKETVYYGRLEREGIYKVLVEGKAAARLDVNLLSEEESDLKKAGAAEGDGSFKARMKEERQGRFLFRELALLGCGLLLFCWFLLERRSA
jgi:hypothetical protein